ncbi:MAG: asparaginase [Fibrobacteres bacterium]|nr:asparaginase [Fibrobacterota bacterium]
MKRIVEVVFTGGTIGSVAIGDTLDTSSNPPRQLLSMCGMEGVEFRESEPFRILSEDAGTEHWTRLAAHLAGLDYANLDAIVVTHGSDTMAWTAKALAFALAGAPVPIVLVGSDRPLADPSSNGCDNFRDAVAFALGEKLPGVYVAWKNRQEPTSIHLAGRILPCDPYDDGFRSARGLRFGVVEKGVFQRGTEDANPTRSRIARSAMEQTWKRSRSEALAGTAFDSRVLVLPARPGADHSSMDPSTWNAILQIAYHSSTAPSQPGHGSLQDLASRCAVTGVPLVLGPCRRDHAAYESASRLERAGILLAPSMEATSLVVKLQWLLGTGRPLSELSTDIAWEILPEAIFPS